MLCYVVMPIQFDGCISCYLLRVSLQFGLLCWMAFFSFFSSLLHTLTAVPVALLFDAAAPLFVLSLQLGPITQPGVQRRLIFPCPTSNLHRHRRIPIRYAPFIRRHKPSAVCTHRGRRYSTGAAIPWPPKRPSTQRRHQWSVDGTATSGQRHWQDGTTTTHRNNKPRG